MKFLYKISSNIIIFFLSCLLGLFLSEVIVRIIKPQYYNLVHSTAKSHLYRIHANENNSISEIWHPDLHIKHLSYTNSSGLRQNREFSIIKPPGVIRIGIYGDSFTENIRIKNEYSFTEPLDYLLNQTGQSVEILNFGIDGYGPDQTYLQYLDTALDYDLDFVIYVYCHNDLRDILANRLYKIDDHGELKYIPQLTKNPILKFLKKFYLTYFVIDIFKMLELELYPKLINEHYDPKTTTTRESEVENRKSLVDLNRLSIDGTFIRSEQMHKALAIFQKLLDRFIKNTKENNQKFMIVLLPRFENANIQMKLEIEPKGVKVLDLYPLFKSNERELSNYFFTSDWHWNEEGNKLAAIYLFKYLVKELDLKHFNDQFIKESLNKYYTSFDKARVSKSWMEDVEISDKEKSDIKTKYNQIR